jgi:hypothetical protein
MQQKRKDNEAMPQQNRPNTLETPGRGQQGVDKAPGEETNTDNVQFTQETQKGKKVDRDPSNPKDEPLEDQDI